MEDILLALLILVGVAYCIYGIISISIDTKKNAAHRKQVESYWDSMADALQRIADKLEM